MRCSHSVLSILDTQSGQVRELTRINEVIEAPNWTPDNRQLIFNRGGSLYTFDLGNSEINRIPIEHKGFINNDHVLSADGRTVYFSSSPDPATGSQIYRVPVTGGPAELLVKAAPSYLHGVSPDEKTLAYCAFRSRENGADIYTCPSGGGPETQLTDTPGLNDGPEYSPDGRYIYFNSVRTGSMQIFRMKADGSEPVQLTFDTDLYNWFAHVSPDGNKLVMISYHAGDLEPGEHLPDKHVLLRMTKADGSDPVTLLSLFGGQGTINVNSWSPDSRHLAFVRYDPE